MLVVIVLPAFSVTLPVTEFTVRLVVSSVLPAVDGRRIRDVSRRLSADVPPGLTAVEMRGAGAVQGVLDHLSNGALLLLAAFSVAATLRSPFAAAAAVRLNLAG